MNTDWSLPPSLLAKYQDIEEWTGSFYELSIAYNRTTLNSQDRIQVPRILWQHPSLLGVVDEPNELMISWQEVEGYDFNRRYHHTYGLLRLEDGKNLACLSFFIDSEAEEVIWLCLAIPGGILSLVFPIEDPLYPKAKNPWIASIDRVFADIAMAVYRRMPFTLATLGSDVPMFFSMEDTYQELREGPDLLIPESLFQQQGVEPCGLRSPEGLWWTGGKK